MENLELWNKVSKTTSDTKTKEVSYWARKFTAIDAYSQIKNATSQFWSYWEAWGFKEIKYDIIEWRIYFIWTFYFPKGEFPIFNDCKVWDDGAKKVFTDSLTKALSYLWFNADVFMGQFDWNKYTTKETSKGTNKTSTNDTPVKWYNDTDKNIKNWQALVNKWPTTWANILAKVTENWVKINWTDKARILALKPNND